MESLQCASEGVQYAVGSLDSGDQAVLSLFMVDSDTQGLNITSTRSVDNRLTAKLHFDSVRLGPEALLGEAGQCWSELERALDNRTEEIDLLKKAQRFFEKTKR